MKITNETTPVYFMDLKAGEVFQLTGLGVYMKTYTKGTCNAVNLSTGDFVECGDYCQVQVIDCELVIH